MNNLINGKWRDAKEQQANLNPTTGAIISQSVLASTEDLEDASAAALASFATTKKRPSFERVAILERIIAGIRCRRQEFSACMLAELGRPSSFNDAEVERAITTFTDAMEEAKRLTGEYLPLDATSGGVGRHAYWKREAIGPVLAITPFNFPLNLLAHKVAPAIATGCTVTVKVPTQTPDTARLLGEVIVEAGCIDGEINIMDCPSEVFEAAVRDDRYKLLSFTGSPKVGWFLKSIAGKKRVLLELGNSSAAIVHHDSQNLDWVAERLLRGALAAAGQVCISVQRLFVHEDIAEDFETKFCTLFNKEAANTPGESSDLIGPMIDEGAAKRVESWIQEAIAGGAEIVAGRQHREGNRLWPVALRNVPRDSKLACEEAFGPVVSLERYSDLDQVIERSNATDFGLQIGVFSDSLSVVQAVIDGAEVAGVIVNDFPTFRVDQMPYGGIKDSGFGREGGKYVLDDYTEKKLVVFNQAMG